MSVRVRRRTIEFGILISFVVAACGAPLDDAQLAWCLDTSPNGTKEVIAYPDNLGGGGLAAIYNQQKAWERSWRSAHPGEPLPTKTIPDETTSNSWAVARAAINLGLDFSSDKCRPGLGETPSSDFVRACLASYETR
ncbi:hypothetical protein BH18ACT6_BH18ACT6_24240 [soil metagenome]